MKNRKREICTSGSVRDEAGQPPHLLGGLGRPHGRLQCRPSSRRCRWSGISAAARLLNTRNQLFVNLLNKIADKFPSDYVKQM
jgi:hypothetical protein